jgi:large conductance mechanosensitive channel
MNGFKQFILRGNVVDLAVGVVIGAAFGVVVQALVKDLITPLIGAFGGVPDFSVLTFTVNNSKFLVGDFINALLAFVLVAAVVYWFVVLPVNKLMERMKGEVPVGPRTRECPRCLSKIPQAADRCAFCTADIEPLLAMDVDRSPSSGTYHRDRRVKMDESADDELKDALKSTRDELKNAGRPAGREQRADEDETLDPLSR